VVVVQALVSYWLGAHAAVHSVQFRSVIRVQAWLSYSLEAHASLQEDLLTPLQKYVSVQGAQALLVVDVQVLVS